MPYPSHFLDFITQMIFREEYRAYAVFSTPLLPHPSWAQISSSALYSRKPSAYTTQKQEIKNISHQVEDQKTYSTVTSYRAFTTALHALSLFIVSILAVKFTMWEFEPNNTGNVLIM
jgi:hypothetical protein